MSLEELPRSIDSRERCHLLSHRATANESGRFRSGRVLTIQPYRKVAGLHTGLDRLIDDTARGTRVEPLAQAAKGFWPDEVAPFRKVAEKAAHG